MNIELILAISGIALTVLFGVVSFFIAKDIKNKNTKSHNKITQNGNVVLGGDIIAGDKNVKKHSPKK